MNSTSSSVDHPAGLQLKAPDAPLPSEARNTAGLRTPDWERLTKSYGDAEVVPLPSPPPIGPFNHRQSQRTFSALKLAALLQVITELTVPRRSWVAADGYEEAHLPLPTAGGRGTHSWGVAVQAVDGLTPGIWLVQPAPEARLHRLNVRADFLQPLRAAAELALRATTPPPALLVPLARARRLLSKYPDGESLVWREAGSMMLGAHLAATSAGLASCMLGSALTLALDLGEGSETVVDTGAVAIGGAP